MTTTTAKTRTFKVSAEDFRRANRGLVHLLKIIQQGGNRGIHTRALYAKLRMTGYGDKLVDKAYEEGYIIRKKQQRPKGNGPWYVFNYLSNKGEKLLLGLNGDGDGNA